MSSKRSAITSVRMILAAGFAVTLIAGCGSASTGGAAGGAAGPVKTAPAGTTGATPDPNGALAKAARAEGSVVWYAPTLGNIDAITAAFSKIYGVKVNLVEQPNVQLQARFEAEAEAGHEAADVAMTGYSSFFQTALDKGWTTPLSKVVPNFPGTYPAAYVKDGGGTAVNMVAATGIAYDTNAVPAADVPTSWADLAKPYWKGKIISVDPNASLGYQQFWDALLTKYGTATVNAIGKNIVRSFATAPSELQSLTAGEGSLVLFTTAGLAAPTIAQGAPVAYKQFDFTTGVDFAIAVSAHAPHPNAAKLFASWLLSTSGQQSFATLSQCSTPLVPSSLPSQYAQPLTTISDARKAQIDQALGVSAS